MATLFNFAHGVLYLCPLVYYSSCLLIFLHYHIATMLLLFIIFKCTIFKCPLCSLHEMTWIYYDYYYFLSVEVILAKQKNTVFSKGTILSLVYQFVFLFPFDYPFLYFALGSGGHEITETTQLYYHGCHMTIYAGC